MVKDKYVIIEGIVLDTKILEFTVPDFIKIADMRLSDLTKRTTAERGEIQGDATKNTKFIQIELGKKGNSYDGSVYYSFPTEATEGKKETEIDPKTGKPVRSHKIQPDTEPKKVVVNKVNRPNPSHMYTLKLRFLNMIPSSSGEGWIIKAMEELNSPKISNKVILNALSKADVQLDSEDPSFLWQGFKYWLTKENASVHPETIYPKKWVNIHGTNAYLTKHFAQLFKRIPWFMNQMASSLNNQIKKLGLTDYIISMIQKEPEEKQEEPEKEQPQEKPEDQDSKAVPNSKDTTPEIEPEDVEQEETPEEIGTEEEDVEDVEDENDILYDEDEENIGEDE